MLRGCSLLLANGLDFLREGIVTVSTGLLIHLVPGTIRAQTRYGTFKLQKLKLRLLEVLLKLGEFTFNDSKLAIALL